MTTDLKVENGGGGGKAEGGKIELAYIGHSQKENNIHSVCKSITECNDMKIWDVLIDIGLKSFWYACERNTGGEGVYNLREKRNSVAERSGS